MYKLPQSHPKSSSSLIFAIGASILESNALCAAFIAQQQGIRLDTAYKKAPAPVADLWLVVAEFARQTWAESVDQEFDELLSRKPATTV